MLDEFFAHSAYFSSKRFFALHANFQLVFVRANHLVQQATFCCVCAVCLREHQNDGNSLGLKAVERKIYFLKTLQNPLTHLHFSIGAPPCKLNATAIDGFLIVLRERGRGVGILYCFCSSESFACECLSLVKSLGNVASEQVFPD